MAVTVSLVAMVGVIAAVGYLLPVSHEASRSAEFTQPRRLSTWHADRRSEICG